MKRFLKKRWHNVPVALVSGLLILALTAGGVLAAYNFMTIETSVTVEEAIYPSFMADDDLQPYMDPETDVLPMITVTPTSETEVTVTIEEDPGRDASEFLPGEVLVLPVNLRNRSNADMPITISHEYTGGDLDLEWVFETNTSGDSFRPTGTWDSNWPATFTITTRGAFGSAIVNATVFFLKISVPTDAAPGTHTITFNFGRG